MRVKTKPQKYRYNNEEDYEYGEKVTARIDAPKRGRPSSRRDTDELKKDVVNPYEKAPYKKRKHYNVEQDPKDESLGRDEVNRGSAKWES